MTAPASGGGGLRVDPTDHETGAPILRPGHNCWRIEQAGRLAFLRDGEAYFRAAAEAMARARRSILLLAWDVDSQVEVNRHGVDGLPARLGEFLDALARREPHLQIHILSWDFSALFALEREALPRLRFEWSLSDQVHLFLDDRHPTGASHHQKILVVDDAVAMAGGFDITRERWDVPEHEPDDPRRRDHASPDGYPPFHDVQMIVDGSAARALGELARERWKLATGESLKRPRAQGDAWPASVDPAMRDVGAGIARTVPAFEEQQGVREVEALFLDEIGAARHCLFVENQYFTSDALVEALESSGWLEEATMGQLRAMAVGRLRAGDAHGRLSVVFPGGSAMEGTHVNVHSKVLIVDDAHVRVGSANMSNRSMGVDTECDLAVDAQDAAARQAIAHFRSELLGEHLGLPASEVSARLAECGGSLRRLIEAHAGASRALVPLEVEEAPWGEAIGPAIELVDPARPPRRQPPRRVRSRRRWFRLAAGALVLATLISLWTWGPLREMASPEAMASLAGDVQGNPAAMLGAIVVHAVAGLVAMPVTLLIVATMLVFGPAWGAGIALAGCLANAAAVHAVGRLLGGNVESRLSGRFSLVTALLRRHGVASIALVRLVPLAPYTVVSVLAGIVRVPFRAYILGTALGLLPGIVALAILGKGLRDALENPSPATWMILCGLVGAWIAGALFLRRRARRLATEAEP